MTDTQLLARELGSWSADKLANTLLMVVSVHPTDACTIIPVAPPTEIVDKCLTLLGKETTDKIITYKSDEHTNKSFMCAWGSTITDLISKYTTTNKSLSHILIVSSDITNSIVHDNQCHVFQQLNTMTKIQFEHKKSRIINENNDSRPAVIFSNSVYDNVLLNRIENYTGNGWNEYYGYKVEKMSSRDLLPKIYISIIIGSFQNARILDILNYPSDRLVIQHNRIDNTHMVTLIVTLTLTLTLTLTAAMLR